MSTFGVAGTGTSMVSSITMLYFMAGSTLFRLEIKISSVRTGTCSWFGFLFFLKGQLIFLMHKLPHNNIYAIVMDFCKGTVFTKKGSYPLDFRYNNYNCEIIFSNPGFK